MALYLEQWAQYPVQVEGAVADYRDAWLEHIEARDRIAAAEQTQRELSEQSADGRWGLWEVVLVSAGCALIGAAIGLPIGFAFAVGG
jgi:hypothetical protein